MGNLTKIRPDGDPRPEAEGLSRLLVEAVVDYAIFALDAQGHVQTWNEGARRMKGYEAGEVIGSHFSRFYAPEDIARNHPQWELDQASRNGTYEEEGWRLKKDGSRFWASVVITALRDQSGALLGFGKVTRDLTHKKIAEDRLRESEERFRLLVMSVQDYAILTLDPNGYVTSWNAGAERIKGYEAKEILGLHFSRFYTPEDVALGKPESELRGATLTGRFEDSGFRVRKDGSRFWANVVVTAIRDSGGSLLGFSKVTRDLTERKKAEDALRAAYDSLEKRVQTRTAELAAAKDEAERAVQARDEFLSIASHELRTPLTSLKLRSQLVKRGFKSLAEPSPEMKKLQSYIYETDEQLDRLVRLVDDMMDLTRVSHGQLPVAPERVDLCDVVQKVVERMAPQFHEKGTPVEFSRSSSAFARADPVRTEQVVLNLLTNALRYAPGMPVRVEVAREGDIIRLSVQDQGPGIPQEKHEQIFARYERLVSASTVSGLGVGLYLSRLIVDAQGGAIYVQSEPGKGSKFIVELPCSDVGSRVTTLNPDDRRHGPGYRSSEA